MDQTEYHKLHGLTQFINSQFLIKVTRLLLSVSVFFFFFSYSTRYPFFLHSFKFHFSTFSFQLLSHTIDKYYIFLICNGILVFLAKTSGIISFSPATDLNDQLFKKIGDGDGVGLQQSLEMNDSLLEKEVSVETTEPLEKVLVEEKEEEYSMEGESEYSNLIVEDKEQELGIDHLLIGEEEEGEIHTAEDEENEKELGTIGFLIEEDDEEENGLLSTEELNKKFDEFIRKMKEEIRIGAQQQLVMA